MASKEPSKTRKPRVVRTVEERIAANELEARLLKIKVAAEKDENVWALMNAYRMVQFIRTLGKKDADSAAQIAKEALGKALAALGF